MDPTEPCRNMPLPAESGGPEERHLCRLSGGMTLEGNHLAEPHIVAALTPLHLSEFTCNHRGHIPSQAPASLCFRLKAFTHTVGASWIWLRHNLGTREDCALQQGLTQIKGEMANSMSSTYEVCT